MNNEREKGAVSPTKKFGLPSQGSFFRVHFPTSQSVLPDLSRVGPVCATAEFLTMSEGGSEVPLYQQDTSLCASCGGKPMALKEDEVTAFLKQLSPKWELSTLNDDTRGSVQVLRKQLLLKDFASVRAPCCHILVL